jgi:glycosyltransferase involved in cell wall biosynthesis
MANGFVVISPVFVPVVRRVVHQKPILVLPNWAPLDEIVGGASERSPIPKRGGTLRVLYSGTLGLKHNPRLLVKCAEGLGAEAELVVVTEGIGRQVLEEARLVSGIDLTLSDFVDYAEFPDLLASADVGLVLLERDAGLYSVPSKVLSYISAGVPVVGSMPTDNSASEVLRESGAGVVVDPDDEDRFVAEVRNLVADEKLRDEMRIRAKSYADKAFDTARSAEQVFGFIAQVRAGRDFD